MSRSITLTLLVLLSAVAASQCPAAENPGSGDPPMTYELMINGESFLVEADRQVKLESQEKPGVTYEIALRIALEQRVSLNTFRFEYDWPAKVDLDRRKAHPTARIQHELGFTMLITDLGQALDDESQARALKLLQESTLEGYQKAGMEQITVAEFPGREFGGSVGRGVMIRYLDGQRLGHTCLIYLMTGSTFTGYCVIEYFDADEANVIPRAKKTLDSIRAIR